jgi:hypothetical protein
MEPGYAAWKRAKTERGLEQSRDRSVMIPVEQVLRDLSLDGGLYAAGAGRPWDDPQLDCRGRSRRS